LSFSLAAAIIADAALMPLRFSISFDATPRHFSIATPCCYAAADALIRAMPFCRYC
jgi:hypothetical protein